VSGTVPPLTVRWRLADDPAPVHALHRTVLALTPPGMVRPDALGHFESHMGDKGHTLGCYLDDGSLVAYGVVGLCSDNVLRLAELLQVGVEGFCMLDGAGSLPEWRGYGLHLSVIDERIRFARELGRSAIGTTVSPENIRSMRGLFHAGMEVHAFALMFGGLARLLLKRELAPGKRSWRHALSVAVADHQGHEAALAAGLRGYACRQDGEGKWHIAYGTPDTSGTN
jgi:hypothetical protein